MKVLLLEDELMLNESIMEYLESLGHIVDSYTDGAEAKRRVTKEYDLLILDVNVPSLDGFTLVEELNEEKIKIPTIYISALVDIDDISRGYELGAFDYIKKPFHLKELGIKIEKLSKSGVDSDHKIISKNYTYSTTNKTLFFNKEPQNLTKKQSEIIDIMVRNLGLIVDFDSFRQNVWENDLIDNPTIRAEINRLKKSLKEDFIINIRGLGYKIEKFYSK